MNGCSCHLFEQELIPKCCPVLFAGFGLSACQLFLTHFSEYYIMNDCQHDNHFFVVGAPENRQRGQQQKKEGRKDFQGTVIVGLYMHWVLYVVYMLM